MKRDEGDEKADLGDGYVAGGDDENVAKFIAIAEQVEAEWEHMLESAFGTSLIAAIDEAVDQED